MTESDMNPRSLRLAELIRLHFDDTQAAFLDVIGGNQGELSLLVKGKKSFGEKKARKIEEKAGLVPMSLDAPAGAPFYASEKVNPKSGATQIETRLNEWSAAAAYNGPGGTSGALESTVGEPLRLRQSRDIPVVGEAQGGPDGYISINDYPAGHGEGWITLYSADPGAYGLRVRGDSMRPRIKSGEHIVVEPGMEAQPGDDVVVKFLDGSAVVKELLWVRDDEVCLGSINNGIPPITRTIDTILSIHRVAAIIPRGSPLYRSAT
ncbi:S24 family peptidase [Cupriavidus sp. BIC8F]|uniref:S24 family peptidase n=1 Tax=Cupriavidus sp. BIC8F TaxID=3079014 RepID=UPI0029163EBF|nr:S24 family peptidase [Cupriavidus sp. BIC8F]